MQPRTTASFDNRCRGGGASRRIPNIEKDFVMAERRKQGRQLGGDEPPALATSVELLTKVAKGGDSVNVLQVPSLARPRRASVIPTAFASAVFCTRQATAATTQIAHSSIGSGRR